MDRADTVKQQARQLGFDPVGIAAAVGATSAIRGLLFNTSAIDPLIYGALSLLLLTMAMVACYVPARRAMRVDPDGQQPS